MLEIVQLLDVVFQGDPAGSLGVMTTAVGYLVRGGSRLLEKLVSMLCAIADAILPQLQVSKLYSPSQHSSLVCVHI